MNAVIKLERVSHACWDGTICLPGNIFLHTVGRSARETFDNLERMMEDAAIESWFAQDQENNQEANYQNT